MSYRIRMMAAVAAATVTVLWAAPALAEKVAWIAPPPVAIQGGDDLTVLWEVSGFSGDLVENAVVWGTAPGNGNGNGNGNGHPDQAIAHAIAQQGERAPDQLNGNCVYTDVITAPTVTEQTTLYFTVVAGDENGEAVADPVPVVITPGFATPTYAPNAPGAFYTYQGGPWYYFAGVIRPGFEQVGCAATRVTEDPYLKRYEYVSVTREGLFLHRAVDGISDSPKRTITYDPPLQLANVELIPGDAAVSSGTWTGVIEGFGTLTYDYTSTATVVGVENIWVPAGTFEAVRINIFVQFSPGFTDTGTIWLVRDIGPVKVYSSVGLRSRELLATNLP